MTTVTTILLEELCAAEAEQLNCEACDSYDIVYPAIWTVDVDGVEWWTDRHWLLPASMLTRATKPWTTKKLPKKTSARAAQWVRDMVAAELHPCERVFAATYAGVLTLAGLTAWAMPGTDMCALVDTEGARAGIVMPLRADHTELRVPRGTTIPAPAAVRKEHERIRATCVLTDDADVWRLAVALAGAA